MTLNLMNMRDNPCNIGAARKEVSTIYATREEEETYKRFEAGAVTIRAVCVTIACGIALLGVMTTHLVVCGVVTCNNDTLVCALRGHLGGRTCSILALGCTFRARNFRKLLMGGHESVFIHG